MPASGAGQSRVAGCSPPQAGVPLARAEQTTLLDLSTAHRVAGTVRPSPASGKGRTLGGGSAGSEAGGSLVLGALDPQAPGPLGERSIVRRMAGEPVTALLVQRALVMELAHPKVAAAVADHSRFRSRPLGRAWSTADVALRIVFGDAETAHGAVRQIYRMHDRINGTTPPGGAPYTAHDAALLRWVWATLVDTAEVAYTRWVRPFGAEEAHAFYAEMVSLARFLGIPSALLPADRAAFADYLEGMLEDPELGSSAVSRTTAHDVLWYRHWAVPPVVVALERALALATLDPRLVERLELRPSAFDRRLGQRLDDLLGAHYRRLPRWRASAGPLYLAVRRPTIGIAPRLRAAVHAA